MICKKLQSLASTQLSSKMYRNIFSENYDCWRECSQHGYTYIIERISFQKEMTVSMSTQASQWGALNHPPTHPHTHSHTGYTQKDCRAGLRGKDSQSHRRQRLAQTCGGRALLRVVMRRNNVRLAPHCLAARHYCTPRARFCQVAEYRAMIVKSDICFVKCAYDEKSCTLHCSARQQGHSKEAPACQSKKKDLNVSHGKEAPQF